ncbi:retrotransposon protein, putative, ty1-copia subclass [Tanacetum coccineum]
MKSYLDTLERLGYAMPNKLGVSLILNYLNKDYDQFVQNYNMHSMGKTIAKLHAMLKLHEKGIMKKAKTPDVLAIREGKIQKDKKKPRGAKGKDKGKNKLAYDPKPKIPPPSKRDNLAKDSICHHYKEVGYWRRNCSSYQAELKKRNNASMASTSGIFTIELYAFPNKTWVYDTGYGTHICNTLQGLKESRKLKHGALSLYIGNGMRTAVEAIRSFDLILPSGLIVVLDNCHFSPSVTRDVVLISRLMARKPFPHQVERAKDLLGHIHTDVCGPFRTVSREGASYFITFTDDFSRYGYVYLMKHKHEVFETFKVFQNEVENQLGKKIKVIRSDRGGEYLSHKFVNHMKSCGIVSQLTPPYTPQHQGVSERRNQTLLDMVRSMMNLTTLPKSFWGYAFESASSNSQYGSNQEGYLKETIGYYFYYPLENKIFVARNAEFFKNSLMVQEASGSHGLLESSRSDEGLELIQEEDIQPSENTSKIHNEVMPIEFEAMNMEMQSMKDNQVWVLVDLPLNGQTFRSKWLFKKNTNMDGNVPTFKARLVAKGYTQTYSVDYEETFSPVADIRAIRIFLAITAFYDYEIWQMDVKTAFFKGHLSKDIYMVQPEGFVDPKHPNKVCKLQRSIYRLKKASRRWNKRFDVEIKKIGFAQNPDEPCVYLKASRSNVAFLTSMSMTYYSWEIMLQCCKKLNLGFTTVKAILKYLRNTKDMILVYGAKPKAKLKVSCYADASFQTDKDDTKSQTGYVFVLNGGAVDWKSAKKITTVMSSTEAEYIVAAKASMESVWMRKFIDGLRSVMPSNKRHMEMLCDNEPARAIANDPGILKGARHFQRKYHYIREVIQEHEIILKKVYIDYNIADPFTKPMSFNKHYEHAMAIRIVPASSIM